MFIDNESELEQASTETTFNESRDRLNSVDEIKRTANGSIDTGYYLEQSRKMRSKSFMDLIKSLFGRAS
jgi:hypothetical protein